MRKVVPLTVEAVFPCSLCIFTPMVSDKTRS